MGEGTQSSGSLLPVPDGYGLWSPSIQSLVRAGTPNRDPRQSLARVALLAVLYIFVFNILSNLLDRSFADLDVLLWNLPMGLGLGVLLGFGWSALPVVAAGLLAGPALTGEIDPARIVVSAAQVASFGLGMAAVRRFSIVSPGDLTDRQTLIAFLLVAPAVALSFPAMDVLATSLGDFPALPSVFADVLAPAFWRNLAGILLLGPFSMMAAHRLRLWSGRRGRSGPPLPGLSRWPYAWRLGVLAVAFLGSSYLIATLPLAGELLTFGLISLPVFSAAFLFGLCGVAPALAVVGLLVFVELGPAFDSALPVQLAAILAAANGSALGLLVTEQRRYQSTMNHQASLIDSVSFAAEQLLGTTDRDRNVQDVLGHLAGEARLERIYVLENRHNAEDKGYPILYEHGKALDQERQDAVSALRGKHIRKSAELLEKGRILELRASELPPGDQAVLLDSGIGETLVLPIFADGHWWGCLGMDQAATSNLWSGPQVATFQATARVLGALLAHTNVEQQFRQFTGSIPVVFWIATPDVLHRTYVSPAYEQIWGRSREGIRQNPRSWMAAIYHEDYARVSGLLERNPQSEFAEEYRIVRPDRSVRWIRDTGFCVRDASGQVNRIVGLAQDMTAQKEAEERLRASEEQVRRSLHEKEVLLKEIHHRVKNNLQVISSLLNLQAGQIQDRHAAQVFRDSQSRVRAMALVHERLYQSEDLARIDFAGYVRDMTTHLLRSYQSESRGIRLGLEVAGVSLDVDAAIPCALIINETVSNAFKYAFPGGRDGEIRISISQGDGKIAMVISDDGVGLPEGMSFETSGSLGLQLVHSLTDQLGGTVGLSTNGGTRFDIQFPYAS